MAQCAQSLASHGRRGLPPANPPSSAAHPGNTRTGSRRIASPNDRPSLAARRSIASTAQVPAQPPMVDLHPLSADQDQLLRVSQERLISAGERFRRRASLPSGSRATHPSRHATAHCLPDYRLTCGRAGRFMRQFCRIRTTMPELSSAGTSSRNASVCLVSHRSHENLATSTMAFNQSNAAHAPLDASSPRKRHMHKCERGAPGL